MNQIILSKGNTFRIRQYYFEALILIISFAYPFKMGLCEMCGKEGNLVVADIEGGELNVCSACAKYGIVKRSSPAEGFKPYFHHKTVTKEEPEFRVVDNFSHLLKSAREKRGLNREDFAKFLNEKESLVAKWEQGTVRPGIDVAKKLGKMLGLHLLEKDESGPVKLEKGKSDELTLGDFIKVKKR